LRYATIRLGKSESQLPRCGISLFDELIDPEWLKRSPSGSLAWLGPPANEIPGMLPVKRVLATGSDLVVWLGGARLYSTGLLIDLNAHWKSSRQIVPPLVPGGRGRRGLCVGAEAVDGRRALAIPAPQAERLVTPPTLSLVMIGARYGLNSTTIDLWLWPSPTAVPVDLVLEWRAQGLDEVRTRLDLTSAASDSERPQTLWES
jgi:hypothetical protein